MGQAAIVSVLRVATGEQDHWWLPQGLDHPASLLAQLPDASDQPTAPANDQPDALATCLVERLRELSGARRVATPSWSQVRQRYLVGLHGAPCRRVVICSWSCPAPGAGWIRSCAPQEWPPQARSTTSAGEPASGLSPGSARGGPGAQPSRATLEPAGAVALHQQP